MPFATPAWDLSFFIFFNQTLRSDLLDAVMPVLSWRGPLWVGAVAACLWLVYRVRRGGGDGAAMRRVAGVFLLMALAVGLADMTGNIIKDVHGRVRPLNALPGVHLQEDGRWTRRPPDYVRTKPRGNSYVSTHAANTAAVAAAAMLFWPVGWRGRRWRGLMLLLPLAVGWSRLYLGKHYPTDVLGGWAVGAVCACAVWGLWLIVYRDPRARRE